MRDVWTFTLKSGEQVTHYTSRTGLSFAQAAKQAGINLHEVNRADKRTTR